MIHNTKKTFVNVLISFCLLFFIGSNALAASEIHMTDFTSGNSNAVDGVGPAKPLMTEVLLIVIGFFLFTCVVGIFASGSTANIGNVFHNVSIRSRGIWGVVTVLGVVGVVIIAVVGFFHLYNKYLAGA